jgi:iron uptake system EfeUOB component EfeO/EfeM
LITNFKKISNKRSLTADELNIFSQKITGQSKTDIEEALASKISGENNAYESLLESAADFNEISPEAIQELFTKVLDVI